ncbi:MAG: phosphoglycerate kinase, partial [Dongiaceae bacterium]
MTRFRTLDDLDVAGKRVLVRSDLNVPVRDGRVTDTARIDRTAATLIELADRRARVVVLSHFGRPEGKRVPEMSLRPIAESLSAALGGRPVAFAEDCVGAAAARVVAGLGDGGIALLENLRFHAGEERNDP